MYNRKDYYYKKAKEEGRASRASYKLEQIQSKYHIIKKGDKVLDLGCAPGGWLEVLSEMVGPKGIVVGADILPIKIQLKPNVLYVQADIFAKSFMDKIVTVAENLVITYDAIVSDMAPNTSGVAFKDAYLSYDLCFMASEVAKKILSPGGNFLAKIFQGEEVEGFTRELKKMFQKVSAYTPPATREASKELYIVAKNYSGVPNY